MKCDELFVKVYGNTKEVEATLAVLENFFDYLRAGKEASERQPVNPVAFGSGKEVAPIVLNLSCNTCEKVRHPREGGNPSFARLCCWREYSASAGFPPSRE